MRLEWIDGEIVAILDGCVDSEFKLLEAPIFILIVLLHNLLLLISAVEVNVEVLAV